MDDDLVLIADLADDLHHVTAIRAEQDVNLFLQDHPFTDLLALIRPDM